MSENEQLTEVFYPFAKSSDHGSRSASELTGLELIACHATP